MSVELRLPLPPSLNDLWSRTRGGGFRCSDRYRAWIKEASWVAVAQRPKRISGPYSLCVELAKPQDKRKHDLDNYSFKAISDLLVSLRIIDDDSLCEELAARWCRDGDGALVHIEPFKS